MAMHHRTSRAAGRWSTSPSTSGVRDDGIDAARLRQWAGFVRERSGAALPGIVPVEHLSVQGRQVRGDRRQRRFDLQADDARDRPRRSRRRSRAREQRRARAPHGGARPRRSASGPRATSLDEVLAVLERAEVPSGGSTRSPTSPQTCTTRRAG
jgi:hypothetical protein